MAGKRERAKKLLEHAPISSDGHHQDTLGHQRLMETLGAGIDNRFGNPSIAGVSEASERDIDRWPPHRTFLFAAALSAVAWMGVIGAISAVI